MVGGMGHVKKPGQLSLRDINKSCVLIITAEKKRLLSSTSGEGSFSSEGSPFIRLPYVTVVWLYFIMSHLMTKPTKWSVCPAKTQITSLSIRPVWSESSLCAQWVAKGPSFLHADSEYSDQTGWMPRLIWAFAGHTCHFVSFAMRQLI